MTDAPLLVLQNLAVGRDGAALFSRVDLTLSAGEILFLLGPNGVGKTTLFRTLLKHIEPIAGSILLDGADIAGWSLARFARAVAFVPQNHRSPFPFKVRDVVLMGRAPHHGAFAAPSQGDRAAADAAIEALGLGALADRPVTEISGGEMQLTLIARALAQGPRLLLLDEPTASLDFGHQVAVLAKTRELARQRGLGVIVSTHDPNQALACADRVARIGRGGAFACGRPEEMITADWLKATYDVEAEIASRGQAGSARVFVSFDGAAT
jgi:iron complex transport system ATP-binding protein